MIVLTAAVTMQQANVSFCARQLRNTDLSAKFVSARTGLTAQWNPSCRSWGWDRRDSSVSPANTTRHPWRKNCWVKFNVWVVQLSYNWRRKERRERKRKTSETGVLMRTAQVASTARRSRHGPNFFDVDDAAERDDRVQTLFVVCPIRNPAHQRAF